MQVQLNSNSNLYSQPSFGMAKLTAKGKMLAKDYLQGNLKMFPKQNAYVDRNMLKQLLQGEVSSSSIQKFMQHGLTDFDDKNASFINKQILTHSGKRAIRRFLEDDKQKALNPTGYIEKNVSPVNLTDKGGVLVDSILDVFDANIANPKLSRRKGIKMLDLIKQYLTTDEHSVRRIILSDDIYSK